MNWDAEAQDILKRYEEPRAAVLPLLRLRQQHEGFVTPEAEAWVSSLTGVPVVHVKEVVSFYTLFHQQPQGRHVIEICRNMSCTLLGADALRKRLEERLGVPDGGTTADGKWTWRTVECLCACEQAPVAQVNAAKYHGPLTLQELDRLLDSEESAG